MRHNSIGVSDNDIIAQESQVRAIKSQNLVFGLLELQQVVSTWANAHTHTRVFLGYFLDIPDFWLCACWAAPCVYEPVQNDLQ